MHWIEQQMYPVEISQAFSVNHSYDKSNICIKGAKQQVEQVNRNDI